MTHEHSAQELAREALRKILVQADCLERYAEGSGHHAWPVPSVFHLQATHFRDFANEALEALASPPSSDAGTLREALDEIASASWPSVNGDDPVKRIQTFARAALQPATGRG